MLAFGHLGDYLTGVMLACLLVTAAAVTDIRTGKIPNALTYSAIGIALALAIIRASPFLLGGMALAFGLSLALFALRSIGGGDVKILTAVGGLLGYPIILDVLFYTVVFGAAMSLVVLVLNGRFLATLKTLFYLAASLPYRGLAKPVPATDLKIPFAVPIMAGTLWAVFLTDFRITAMIGSVLS